MFRFIANIFFGLCPSICGKALLFSQAIRLMRLSRRGGEAANLDGRHGKA